MCKHIDRKGEESKGLLQCSCGMYCKYKEYFDGLVLCPRYPIEKYAEAFGRK